MSDIFSSLYPILDSALQAGLLYIRSNKNPPKLLPVPEGFTVKPWDLEYSNQVGEFFGRWLRITPGDYRNIIGGPYFSPQLSPTLWHGDTLVGAITASYIPNQQITLTFSAVDPTVRVKDLPAIGLVYWLNQAAKYPVANVQGLVHPSNVRIQKLFSEFGFTRVTRRMLEKGLFGY